MRVPTALRLAIGVAISVTLLAVTIARVDLARTADAIAAAAPLGIALGVAIVLVDLSIRALRWRVLLAAAGSGTTPPYRLAFGYLSVGFAANAVLPARLGDVARAILAGTAFGLPRLATFGTVVAERLADGLTMLSLVLLSSLVLRPTEEIRNLAMFGLALAVVGSIVLAVGWVLVSRPGSRRFTAVLRVRDLADRVAVGVSALRSPRTAAAFVLLTAAAATTAVAAAFTVARSVGVTLSPLEAVMFLSGIALSLAIPAAPGSLGTYEFVGVAIITSLGFSPEQALAVMVLMRVVTTFPPVISGVISLLALQIHVRALVASRGGGSEPAA
jgi:glycosyltransferase 2 family protein